MQLLKLEDGRELAWTSYGDAEGAPLFYLHGAGSSRLEAAYADGLARRLRLRIVAVDRPGYGHSTPAAEPGFAAFARDLLALADALQWQRFGVAGMSAGGPYALHLAVLAPQRVRAVALINASSEAAHPAWRATPFWLRPLMRVVALPPLLRPVVSRLKADPAKFCARPARREAWDASAIAQFIAATGEGMRQDGAVDAMIGEARRVLSQPWALDWERLQCPVLAICGEGDPGRWFYRELARRLPRLTLLSIGGGHQPFIREAAWQRIAALMASG